MISTEAAYRRRAGEPQVIHTLLGQHVKRKRVDTALVDDDKALTLSAHLERRAESRVSDVTQSSQKRQGRERRERYPLTSLLRAMIFFTRSSVISCSALTIFCLCSALE